MEGTLPELVIVCVASLEAVCPFRCVFGVKLENICVKSRESGCFDRWLSKEKYFQVSVPLHKHYTILIWLTVASLELIWMLLSGWILVLDPLRFPFVCHGCLLVICSP